MSDYEFMSEVPKSVMIPGIPPVFENDFIYHLTVEDLLLTLENDAEFYKNTTPQQMKRTLNKLLYDQIEVLRADFGWYLEKAMPKFLAKDFEEHSKKAKGG